MEINNKNIWAIIYGIVHVILIFLINKVEFDNQGSFFPPLLIVLTILLVISDLAFVRIVFDLCMEDKIKFTFKIPNPFKLSDSYKQKRANKLKLIENKLSAQEKILELRRTLIDYTDNDVMFERIVNKIEMLELQNCKKIKK